MKSLRIRFAIGFSILFTVVMAIAFIIVYISYADFRKEEYYNRLKGKAMTTFKLLTEVEQVDQELLQVIDKNTLNSLYDEKVLIFENNDLIYSSIDDKNIQYNQSLLSMVKLEKELHITQNENEVVGVYVEQGKKSYTILASAYDKYGRRKMNFLKWVMVAVYFAGLALGWVATYFFVRNVLQPLYDLKNNLQKIGSDNLHTRLAQAGQGEEVDSLAASFNQMMERLQQAFSLRKDFVHYASHELRTPMTAMVTLTENALSRDHTTDQYRSVLQQLFQQQQTLTSITNSLLLLSDKNEQTEEYPRVRLDELVFRSVEIVHSLFPTADIAVNIEGDIASEETLLVRANEPLLVMAFNNLLKNAVQYSSPQAAQISIRSLPGGKEIAFSNMGEPFLTEEEGMIFVPFFRASTAKNTRGHGLGLPLVKQIADLHGATVQYTHRDGANIFTVFLAAHKKIS